MKVGDHRVHDFELEAREDEEAGWAGVGRNGIPTYQPRMDRGKHPQHRAARAAEATVGDLDPRPFGDEPVLGTDEFENDDDGYPTDGTLECIENWSSDRNFNVLMENISSIFSNYGRIRKKRKNHRHH